MHAFVHSSFPHPLSSLFREPLFLLGATQRTTGAHHGVFVFLVVKAEGAAGHARFPFRSVTAGLFGARVVFGGGRGGDGCLEAGGEVGVDAVGGVVLLCG